MSKQASPTHPFFAAPQHTVTTSRATVAYRKLGSGPAIMFIHGWPLHGATYRDAAVQLSDRFTCYVIDLPGAGDTAGYDDWSNPLRAHVKTIIEVIDGLGLDRLALVGHDSGGAMARWVAAELGDRITGLVLSNTEITNHIVKVVKQYASLTKVPGSLFLMRQLFKLRRFRRSGYGFGGCFADRDLIDGDFHDLFVAPLLANPAKFKQTMGLLANVDFEELADLGPIHARITAPTSFVWGARDPFFPIAGARDMAGEFAKFRELVEVPDARLLVHEEYPELLVAATAELLQTQAATLTAVGKASSSKVAQVSM